MDRKDLRPFNIAQSYRWKIAENLQATTGTKHKDDLIQAVDASMWTSTDRSHFKIDWKLEICKIGNVRLSLPTISHGSREPINSTSDSVTLVCSDSKRYPDSRYTRVVYLGGNFKSTSRFDSGTEDPVRFYVRQIWSSTTSFSGCYSLQMHFGDLSVFGGPTAAGKL